MGSCEQLNMSIQCFGVCLSHTDTHTHIYHLAVPTTPMWGKTTAAAADLSFQPVTKERPPSVTGLSVLLMDRQKYHLVHPSKDRTRRPHTKSVKPSQIWAHFLFAWKVSCEFRSDHECSIVSRHHSRLLPGVLTCSLPICKSKGRHGTKTIKTKCSFSRKSWNKLFYMTKYNWKLHFAFILR